MAQSARLALLLLLAGCGDRKPLRIAVVGSAGAPLGAMLAVEDINAAGGINGTLLELTVVNEPTRARGQDAIAIAESLSADPRILAVIGHGGSAASLAASTVYNARHVPQVAPNSSSPLYTHAGPFSFRLVASDEHQAEFIASRIREMRPQPRVAVLYVNDDYGRALFGFLHTLLSQRASVVQEAPFLGGDAFTHNLGDILRSVTDAKPDLLVWIGLPPELALLRPRLRKALPRLRVFGSDGVSFVGSGQDLIALDGDLVVSYADLTAARPALQDVAARFRPVSGRALTDGAALSYDAAGLLGAALRSGARTRAGVARYLTDFGRSGRVYDGIAGPIAFDTNGDARPSYVLFKVQPDGLHRVFP